MKGGMNRETTDFPLGEHFRPDRCDRRHRGPCPRAGFLSDDPAGLCRVGRLGRSDTWPAPVAHRLCPAPDGK